MPSSSLDPTSALQLQLLPVVRRPSLPRPRSTDRPFLLRHPTRVLLYGYRGLLVFPGMSSLDEPFLPTAKRHSTLFSSSTRYHKLLVLALIALLALTVAPANAAGIPPQCRQYKCTRSLVYETVKREREPPARPDQAFRIVSIYIAVATHNEH